MMDFGVWFLQPDWQDYTRGARLAEENGFKVVGVIDSPYNFMDVYPIMTSIALGTEKIDVGPFVTNPVTRHPSITAAAMATLSIMSGGRAFLGYGRGDSAVKMLGLNPAKWRDYETSVREIRSWMAGEPVQVEGAPDAVVMPWAKNAPVVPISLGVFGPRGCRTAGQLADVATAECAELGATQWFYSMVQEEAQKAGRGPVPFEVSIATYISDDVTKAREMCRWEPEILTNVLWHLFRTYPLDTLPPSMAEGFEWLADIHDWWGQHDWSKHAQVDEAHQRIISDALVDKWTVCGSVDTVVDKLRELEKIGVSRFICYFSAMAFDELEQQIRAYGERVIPQFAPAGIGAPQRAQV